MLGNVSLSLFLAMALMSLKLWELASLALPMIIIRRCRRWRWRCMRCSSPIG
nr:Glutamate permease [Klebsiella pneumoniae]